MRMALAACLVALAIAGPARPEHCGEVAIVTRHTALWPDGEAVTLPFVDEPVRTPGADPAPAGCADPEAHLGESAAIAPGTNSATVVYDVTAPTNGTLTFAGNLWQLAFVEKLDVNGATYYESVPVYFDTSLSFDGGEAVATVCVEEICETAIYRTLF